MVFIAGTSCILITLFDRLAPVMVFIFITLFAGGAVVPSNTGIIIDCVPAEMRVLSSAVSQMVFNLFGYALSPLLSGAVAEAVSNGNPTEGYKAAFQIVCYWSVVGLFAMGMAFWRSKVSSSSSYAG